MRAKEDQLRAGRDADALAIAPAAQIIVLSDVRQLEQLTRAAPRGRSAARAARVGRPPVGPPPPLPSLSRRLTPQPAALPRATPPEPARALEGLPVGSATMAPPPTHRQRAAPGLHRLLRRARPHRGAVGQPDPARPDGAVHGGRHGAVQALLHRRRDAAVPPGHGRAEVRPGRRQAQRPRRRRPHPPPPRLLRDDGQLQLRRLLQGDGHPVGVGATSPRTSASTATASGSRSTPPTTRPSRSGTTSSACRWSASSASATRTTSGRWATPARAGRAPSCTSTGGPAYGPDGGPLADPAGERFIEFWNLVFMQYDQAPDGTRTPLPRPSIDTGAGLERILTLLQGVDSVWDTDVLRPDHRGGVLAHRPRLRPRRAHRRQPAHPGRARPLGHHARQRRRLPVQRGPGLRPAPHPAPGRPPRLPARRREARACRAWSRSPST